MISPKGRTIGWSLLAAAGLAGWLLSFGDGDIPRVWRALLVNFTFFNSLAAGILCWSAIMTLAQARWLRGIEAIPLAGQAFAIPSVTSLLLLWIGSEKWAPWYGETFHQGAWLHPTFIFARNLTALLLLWWCGRVYAGRLRHGKVGNSAGIYVFTYCIVLSLLGFDLVMALDPHWFSSLFGGYFFISSLFTGAAAWALVAAAGGRA
ncbi:MAG TPA: hypothetical protein VNX25_05645, partial [Verrucomicrobiae bacterium]|nr:hypothetical protein [Verrucomicrobiae bacterium]